MTLNNETASLPKPGSKTKNLLKLLLKILVTTFCLYYVSGKVDLQKSIVLLNSVNNIWLLGALLFYIVTVGASLFGLLFIFIDPLPPNDTASAAINLVKLLPAD